MSSKSDQWEPSCSMRTDRPKNRHEANSRILQFFENEQKFELFTDVFNGSYLHFGEALCPLLSPLINALDNSIPKILELVRTNPYLSRTLYKTLLMSRTNTNYIEVKREMFLEIKCNVRG